VLVEFQATFLILYTHCLEAQESSVPREAHLGQRGRPSCAGSLAHALPRRGGEGASSQHVEGISRLSRPNWSYTVVVAGRRGGWSRREGCAKLGYRKRKLHRPRDVFVRQTGPFRLRHGIPPATALHSHAPSVNAKLWTGDTLGSLTTDIHLVQKNTTVGLHISVTRRNGMSQPNACHMSR